MLSVVVHGLQITHDYRDFGEVFLVRFNDIRIVFLKSLQFSESALRLSNHKSLLNPNLLGMDAQMESKLNVLFVVMSFFFPKVHFPMTGEKGLLSLTVYRQYFCMHIADSSAVFHMVLDMT